MFTKLTYVAGLTDELSTPFGATGVVGVSNAVPAMFVALATENRSICLYADSVLSSPFPFPSRERTRKVEFER
jgi:hypothetical protein